MNIRYDSGPLTPASGGAGPSPRWKRVARQTPVVWRANDTREGGGRDGAHLGKGTRRAAGQPREDVSPSESGAGFSSDSSVEAMRAYSRARTGHVHASMRSGCARGAGSRR